MLQLLAKPPLLLCTPALILLLLAANETKAQPYYFRHYQVENGLSNNTVNCSVQDRNGFLWFGTKEGLNRFDGYHFKLFNPNGNNEKTFTPDRICCLFLDKQGVLWVGAHKGLFRFDAQKEKLVQLVDSIKDISNIQADAQGQLWFTSGYDMYCYNFTGNTLRAFPAAKYFYATSICLSEEGDLWFSTWDGWLQRFNPATQTFTGYNVFSHSPAPNTTWIQKISAAGKGSLFIGTSGQGLKQFDIATSTYQDILTYNPDKTAIFVRDIARYSESQYWFATESGIFIYDTGTKQFTNLKKKFLDPYSLSDNAVYTLCRDTEGGMWAGTFFGGVNYYSKQYSVFKKYFPDNSAAAISGSAVREICGDRYGNLWIGTEDAGLNKLNPETGAIEHFLPTGLHTSIDYSNIHGLMTVGDDLWIGTFEHGIDIMDLKSGKVKKKYTAGPGKKDLKSNFALCFLRSASGQIFIGTSNGFYRYNKAEDNFETPLNPLVHSFITSITEDQDKVIWIATNNAGAFWYNPFTGQQGHLQNEPGNRNSLTTDAINAIYTDHNNNIWFATEGGGLCRLSSDRKTISRYTTREGLPSNYIFNAIEDNRNRLWVSTSKGLASFDAGYRNIMVYTKANGLLYDQFNYHSGYRDSAGNMYFGSIKGMIVFNPDDLVQSHFVPPVYITGFQVHNQELDNNLDSSSLKKSIVYTDEITLPYDQSSFSIDFAALSYTSPEMTAYSYRMDGLDKDWTFIKSNRKVYFTNLSPGRYVFRLKAAANGSWSKTEKQLLIRILPPFWESVWAYLLYTALAAALLYYLVSSYHRKTQIRKEKEIYEAKIEFFTNVAHEIRTPLTLIKGPVENLLEKTDALPEIREDVAMMNRNTNRLIALVTQILDFRQTETKGFSLDFARVDIDRVLQDEYMDFMPLAKKRNLQYALELPPAPVHAFADEEALHKIFSNLLSNAVKYAQRKVHIRLHEPRREHTHFIVEVSNDGPLIPAEMREKIFEPFFRLKEMSRQKGTGIGLTLARSLAELHRGSLYLQDSSAGLNNFILCLPFKPESIAPATKTKRLSTIK